MPEEKLGGFVGVLLSQEHLSGAVSFQPSRVLKLVCVTPELAMADQELAAAYSVTLMKVRAKHRLAASEAAWLKRRNRAPLEVATLLNMYRQRIVYLRSLAR